MASDPAIVGEALGVAMAAAAFFAGLAGSAGLRSIPRRGDGGGTRRANAAMAAASAAVAIAAWGFVTATRAAVAPAAPTWYAAAGGAAGLLVGLFPRAAGVPLALAAFASAALLSAGLSGWLPWTPGTEAAAVTVYAAGPGGSSIALRYAARGGGIVEQDLSFGPGDLRLTFELVDVRGPASLAFGRRRYRLSGASADGDGALIKGDRGPLLDALGGGRLAKALGCSVAELETPPFGPEALAAVAYLLRDDGAIAMEER